MPDESQGAKGLLPGTEELLEGSRYLSADLRREMKKVTASVSGTTFRSIAAVDYGAQSLPTSFLPTFGPSGQIHAFSEVSALYVICPSVRGSDICEDLARQVRAPPLPPSFSGSLHYSVSSSS
jgi:hypothetical protein